MRISQQIINITPTFPSFNLVKQNKILSVFLAVLGATALYVCFKLNNNFKAKKLEAKKVEELALEKWAKKFPKLYYWFILVEQKGPTSPNMVVETVKKAIRKNVNFEKVDLTDIYIVGMDNGKLGWYSDPLEALNRAYNYPLLGTSLVIFVKLNQDVELDTNKFKEKYPNSFYYVMPLYEWKELKDYDKLSYKFDRFLINGCKTS
jgi:hypothetical protein